MFSVMRALVLGLAAGVAGAAFGGDAYYNIPIHELKLTEGELPIRKDQESNRLYTQMERLRLMRPYAVLDTPGEVYVVGRGMTHNTWYSPYYDGEYLSPTPPERNGSRSERTPGYGTQVYIRAPEGKDLTGRLYVPNADLTGMLVLKFAVPAAAAKADAKPPFLWAKTVYYDGLWRRDIPGGAWFRYQDRLVRKERNLRLDETPSRETFRPGFNRSGSLADTYELFSGGRAMSENLQLDRTLPFRNPDETPVKIDTLSGITIDEIDWKPLIGDAKPKLDPLAAKIPFDQHAVFFPSFKAALAVADETRRHDTPVLRLAQPRSENADVIERYQRQLGLPMSQIARLLGPHVVRSMAITGSDPYYPLGTDVAVLFETPNPEVLEKLLQARITLAAGKMKNVNPGFGATSLFDNPPGDGIFSLRYTCYVAPDRSMSSYIAKLDGAVVVTNSIYQLERLASVARGDTESIATLPEFKFFRIRYPLGAADETALAFLSDATIRRWCGPRWRIADSRRTRARAIMADLQAAQLDALVKKTVQPGPIHTEFPVLGGELTLEKWGVTSATYGTLDFTTPIGEIPLDEVTKAEAEAYERRRDGYQQNWNWAFDPIALKIGLGEKQVDRRPERDAADYAHGIRRLHVHRARAASSRRPTATGTTRWCNSCWRSTTNRPCSSRATTSPR